MQCSLRIGLLGFSDYGINLRKQNHHFLRNNHDLINFDLILYHSPHVLNLNFHHIYPNQTLSHSLLYPLNKHQELIKYLELFLKSP